MRTPLIAMCLTALACGGPPAASAPEPRATIQNPEAEPERAEPATRAEMESPSDELGPADPGELVVHAFTMLRELSGRIEVESARATYTAPDDWVLPLPELSTLFRGDAASASARLVWGRDNIPTDYDATWLLAMEFSFRNGRADASAYRTRLESLGFERHERRPGMADYTRYRNARAPMEVRVDESADEDEVSYYRVTFLVWGHGLEVPFDDLGDERLAALARLPGAHTLSLERNAVPTRDYPEVAMNSFDRVGCVEGAAPTATRGLFEGLSADRLPGVREEFTAYFRAPSETELGVVIKRERTCLFGGARIHCARPGCRPAR